MNIIRKAVNQKKSISDIELLTRLKKSKIPLVLWGASKLAKLIYRILKDNNIPVSSVFIDNPNDNIGFYGIKIKSFDEICSTYERFNIIIAHSEYHLRNTLLNNEHVEDIFTIFDFPRHGFSWDNKFLIDNSNEINLFYDNLSDTFSKESFEAYVISRATNSWDRIQPFIVDNQYFLDFIKLTKSEVFIDCGAYTGDTLLDFVQKTQGEFVKYFAYEPSPVNSKILENIIADRKLDNVEIVRKGAWDKQEYFSFEEDTDTSHMTTSITSNNSITIETDLIDNLVSPPITFIKMDIEGAELMALKGASKTISVHKPKLAIAIYHRTDDLITIPAYIKELRPDYKFYFRIHTKLGTDAVLYAL